MDARQKLLDQITLLLAAPPADKDTQRVVLEGAVREYESSFEVEEDPTAADVLALKDAMSPLVALSPEMRDRALRAARALLLPRPPSFAEKYADILKEMLPMLLETIKGIYDQPLEPEHRHVIDGCFGHAHRTWRAPVGDLKDYFGPDPSKPFPGYVPTGGRPDYGPRKDHVGDVYFDHDLGKFVIVRPDDAPPYIAKVALDDDIATKLGYIAIDPSKPRYPGAVTNETVVK